MSRDGIPNGERREQLTRNNLKLSDALKSPRQYRQQNSFIRSTLVLILLNGFIYSQMNSIHAQADDSAAAPAFDMGTLASLASNLGSNPQIMSLVSSFLNPAGGQQKPAVGSVSSSLAQSDLSAIGDIETNSISNTGLDRVDPLKRGTRLSPEQAQTSGPASPIASAGLLSGLGGTGAVSSSPSTTSNSQSTQSAASNPLGGLMSMLPSMLSGLGGSSGGGLNLGGLSSLLGLAKPAQASATTSSTSRSSDPDPSQSGPSTVPSSGVASAAGQPVQSAPISASNQPITAQQVINLVLTSYASGQIPNELIQLGLSGRVPPAIIELALSGQVPLEIIRMVITGQVPTTTINAFLGAMQQAQQAQQGQASQPGGGASASAATKTSSPGVFAATRYLFEALFSLARPKDPNHPESSKAAIKVPTLIGPIPLKMPSLPNMRSIGQLVGGTISNFSSMIPF